MAAIRIIPRLDVKAPNLVKGIHLEGLRVMGDPARFARHYYRQGADEILFMDIVASLYGRNQLLPLVERVAREVFIPLTVGGGLRTLDDMRTVLLAGADKIAINTAAVRQPELINQAAHRFGSSTIVISIEAKKRPGGWWEVMTDNGREVTGRKVAEWVRECESRGAGEILLTSVDREGTGQGYDLDLVREVGAAASVPVVACGGAGRPGHLAEVLTDGRADAVSLAGMLHYEALQLPELESPARKARLTPPAAVQPHPLPALKADLASRGFSVRLEHTAGAAS